MIYHEAKRIRSPLYLQTVENRIFPYTEQSFIHADNPFDRRNWTVLSGGLVLKGLYPFKDVRIDYSEPEMRKRQLLKMLRQYRTWDTYLQVLGVAEYSFMDGESAVKIGKILTNPSIGMLEAEKEYALIRKKAPDTLSATLLEINLQDLRFTEEFIETPQLYRRYAHHPNDQYLDSDISHDGLTDIYSRLLRIVAEKHNDLQSAYRKKYAYTQLKDSERVPGSPKAIRQKWELNQQWDNGATEEYFLHKLYSLEKNDPENILAIKKCQRMINTIHAWWNEFPDFVFSSKSPYPTALMESVHEGHVIETHGDLNSTNIMRDKRRLYITDPWEDNNFNFQDRRSDVAMLIIDIQARLQRRFFGESARFTSFSDLEQKKLLHGIIGSEFRRNTERERIFKQFSYEIQQNFLRDSVTSYLKRFAIAGMRRYLSQSTIIPNKPAPDDLLLP